jgi:hypothetical protein
MYQFVSDTVAGKGKPEAVAQNATRGGRRRPPRVDLSSGKLAAAWNSSLVANHLRGIMLVKAPDPPGAGSGGRSSRCSYK